MYTIEEKLDHLERGFQKAIEHIDRKLLHEGEDKRRASLLDLKDALNKILKEFQ